MISDVEYSFYIPVGSLYIYLGLLAYFWGEGGDSTGVQDFLFSNHLNHALCPIVLSFFGSTGS
jgi:hypothetical protein